jgi:hypothetical protein
MAQGRSIWSGKRRGVAQAEHNLSLPAVQPKVSGCFRRYPAATAFARLRAHLATLRKQGQPLLVALQAVFTGRPIRYLLPNLLMWGWAVLETYSRSLAER